jgi:hypothetical protein
VYKFPLPFRIGSASLYASMNTHGPDARGILEVATDPQRGWTRVAEGITTCPGGGPMDISDLVRGARTIYVRARMKGRDDGKDSATAQFLRTSTMPDGHLDMMSPYVFELRAYDQVVPILTGTVEFNDGRSRLWIDSDGVFWLDRVFDKLGAYEGRIEVSAGSLPPVSRILKITCVPGPAAPLRRTP